MTRRHPSTHAHTWLLALVACISLSFTIAACGSNSAAGNGATVDSSPLLVWTDSTRLPGVQLYQKKHPDVKMTIVTVDPGTLPTKVLLFNSTGKGWPDVSFEDTPDRVSFLSDSHYHFTQDLTNLVPKNVLDNFAAGSLVPCQINGKLYCLRNDLAQDVLWYNKKLMDQFGYQVPTTWEEYQALGLRVAKEHPGYVIGSFGDSEALDAYFWPSRCPVTSLKGPDLVHINLTDPNCTRVSQLIDPLLQAKVLTTTIGPFDDGFTKLGNEDKILMLPGASWYGEFLFKATYKTPKGELAAAPPLRWASEQKNWTGAEGGGMWYVSSHTKHLQAAVDLAVWMATSNDYQATAPTFPAYLPASEAWGKQFASDSFYATDPYPVLKDASGLIEPSWDSVRYDYSTAFQNVVNAAVAKGESIASTLSAYQTQLLQLAQLAEYNVV